MNEVDIALERFESIWRRGQIPDLSQTLRESGGGPELLAELIATDIEYRWRRAADLKSESTTTPESPDGLVDTPLLEDYLSAYPELGPAESVGADLIAHEYYVRTQWGDQPAAHTYKNRFPRQYTDFCAELAEMKDELSAIRLRSAADSPSPTAFDENTLPPESDDVDSTSNLSELSTLYPSEEDDSNASLRIRVATGKKFGDYQLLEELGRGGMGVVYRARQMSADRVVALKVIRQDHLETISPDRRRRMVERFRNESRAAANLEHDHAVTIYDVGEVDGLHYYSMRFVAGADLAKIVVNGPLEDTRAARYMESAARAVHEAHQLGVLHRDIKPANILIDDRNDRALVTDFGLARLHGGGSTATRAEDLLGSPSYMSPEQARNPAAVDAATDVYALGATLYHLITGRPPFLAASVTQTLDHVQNADPVPPRKLNPDVDLDLETICLKCLAKDPHQRYATAADLADDLRRFLNHEPIVARPPTPLQLFLRWYPKHASTMLGAYYLVTPLTWVFFIIGGLFQDHAVDTWRLSSPVFLIWAAAWMALGYCMLKYGHWFELANVPMIIAFASLPLFLDDRAQSIVIIGLISLIGAVLQIGALWMRRRAMKKGGSTLPAASELASG